MSAKVDDDFDELEYFTERAEQLKLMFDRGYTDDQVAAVFSHKELIQLLRICASPSK